MIPRLRSQELFNADYFIVCQTNPHVLPFVQFAQRSLTRPWRRDKVPLPPLKINPRCPSSAPLSPPQVDKLLAMMFNHAFRLAFSEKPHASHHVGATPPTTQPTLLLLPSPSPALRICPSLTVCLGAPAAPSTGSI
jgi:hypothetical protein